MLILKDLPTNPGELEEKIYRMTAYGEGVERNGLYWSEEEVAMLKTDYDNLVPIPILALKYQRTQLAIMQKMITSGGVSGPGGKPRTCKLYKKKTCLCEDCAQYKTCEKRIAEGS